MSAPAADLDLRIASCCICCGGTALRKSPAILMPFVAKRVFDWEPVEITADWGLRDIPIGIAYPLCNSLQCPACGALFLDIRFTAAEMAALYAGYRDETYTSLRERFEPGYRTRNQILERGSTYIGQVEQFLAARVPSTVDILDWGGDTGINTPFKTRANLLHVYDISGKSTVAGARRVTLELIGNTSYDLIVLSNVLEHLPFPVESLSEVAAAMRKKTLLYIEVPHEDLVRLNPSTADLHVKKKHWHEHVNFFTEKSLASLLNRCNLRMLDMLSHEVSVGGRNAHVFSVACALR